MSETRKTRNMTAKGFLAKTNTRAAHSAIAFLSQYRTYLVTGELAQAVSPIIAKLDKGEILPTPALIEIQYATMAHIIESDSKKMTTVSSSSGSRQSSTKPWQATIYDANGNIQSRINNKGEVEDLDKGFDLASDADRWIDRRLFEGASDWYGMVSHTVIPNISTKTLREDAVARILKKPKGPTVQVRGKSTKTLGFGVKAHETKVSFSSG